MFDISPVCQANLALWHAITGLITAVCGLEGTRALLAALTGPDRLIRSAGTRNSNSQTPHISYAGSRRFESARGIVPYTCFLTPLFSSPGLTHSLLTTSALFHILAGSRFSRTKPDVASRLPSLRSPTFYSSVKKKKKNLQHPHCSSDRNRAEGSVSQSLLSLQYCSL